MKSLVFTMENYLKKKKKKRIDYLEFMKEPVMSDQIQYQLDEKFTKNWFQLFLI